MATLAEFKEEYSVKVYAFCLMTHHIHLIVQPGKVVAGLGQLMKRLAGCQTRSVNRREKRSGTLWESRYQSSPIQTDAYLLACCHYVELNPVRAGRAGRAGRVANPNEYRWSSYIQGAGVAGIGIVFLLMLPLTLLATGWLIWWRRQRR